MLLWSTQHVQNFDLYLKNEMDVETTYGHIWSLIPVPNLTFFQAGLLSWCIVTLFLKIFLQSGSNIL